MPPHGRYHRDRSGASGSGVHAPRIKHSMRKSPYLVSLGFLLAAAALTILNIKVRILGGG